MPALGNCYEYWAAGGSGGSWIPDKLRKVQLQDVLPSWAASSLVCAVLHRLFSR